MIVQSLRGRSEVKFSTILNFMGSSWGVVVFPWFYRRFEFLGESIRSTEVYARVADHKKCLCQSYIFIQTEFPQILPEYMSDDSLIFSILQSLTLLHRWPLSSAYLLSHFPKEPDWIDGNGRCLNMGEHTMSQLTRYNLNSSPIPPHRNFRWSFYNLSQLTLAEQRKT